MTGSKIFRVVDFIHAPESIASILSDISTTTDVQFELISTPERFQRCSGPGSAEAMKWLASVAPDIVCLCSPSYLLAKETKDFDYEAAFAPELSHYNVLRFTRSHCGNHRAVHCSYLVLPKQLDNEVQSIEDLCRSNAGKNISFVYNDDMSMSGLYVAKATLDKFATAHACSVTFVRSGGHAKSLERLSSIGHTACASIDVCVLLDLLFSNSLCMSCARSVHSALLDTSFASPEVLPTTCLMCPLRVCTHPIDIFPIQPFAISSRLTNGQREMLLDAIFSWRSMDDSYIFSQFHNARNSDYYSIPKAHRLGDSRSCKSNEA